MTPTEEIIAGNFAYNEEEKTRTIIRLLSKVAGCELENLDNLFYPWDSKEDNQAAIEFEKEFEKFRDYEIYAKPIG